MGPSCGDSREEASRVARPLGSVSQRGGRGNGSPAQTTLSAAPPTARVPATQQEPQEHTTHSKRGRSRPWGRAGGGVKEGGGAGEEGGGEMAHLVGLPA
ncbi:uncharacterized protein LOC102552805 [Rattus norvegicus]|uniref:Methamphetamine responsive transcript 3 n=1 Tax=Rattus norvegicus TaxID=10116 RepID=M5ABH3_RAT|nr:uncharacterized protein LOC102552805 [Rattus norvegicus]BAN05622.1 methamphetamine responsive transcript 3 [Rattus norvegicus]|eukprot:NP_001288575.1 uncharacterized protein LOC102552805 [Rattus norvegicus]